MGNRTRSVIVRAGDHLASIAFAHGAEGRAIWNHPKNQPLRESGRKPNQLHPGDLVYVPVREPETFRLRTGTTNSFQATIPLLRTRVQFIFGTEPMASSKYRLTGLSTGLVEGTTDADGWIEFTVSPQDRVASAWFEETDFTIGLQLGVLDPIETESGVRMRLCLLGYWAGALRGSLNDHIQIPIASFQSANGLESTGEMNDETRRALRDAVGC